MRKALLRTLCASALITSAFSLTAFAQTITNVSFTATIEDSDATSTSGQDPTFEVTETELYSMDWEVTSADTLNAYKTPRTYKLNFSAEGDNEFAKAANITVSGTGVKEIVSKTVKDDGQTLEVKVKAWPYIKMETPEVSEDDGSKITITKNGAGTVEYVLTYTDFDGEEHTVHSTTTGTTIKTTSYNKAYSGSNEEYKGTSKEVTGCAVRAIKPSSASNPYIVPSDWSQELDCDVDMTNYETWSDYFDKGSSSSKSTSKTTSAATATSTTTTTPTSTASAGGWSGSGNDWYYKKNGSNVTGWVADGGNWYYCDPAANGKMKAGWVHHTDGYWYYLNEAHDGTYGRMLTSWQTINGVTYYFRPNDGGPKGSMVIGTVKINGTQYTFNNDGALVK